MRKRSVEKPSKSKLERVADALDLPKDVVLDCSKTTVFNNNQIIIENYKGILEYTAEKIRIKTPRHMLCINGERLLICAITESDIYIEGKISNIGWE